MRYSNNDTTHLLYNFLYCLDPNGIERQEAHQQQVFTNNCDLPIECNDWHKLESWGVLRGEKTDSLFLSCVLPKGWTKQTADHSMYSNLVDADGLIRASIFYKGAFYDRAAHTSVITERYCVSRNYDIKDGEAYEIRDLAAKTTVKQYPASYWGYIVENKSLFGFGNKIVGLIHNGLFHYKPIGKYSNARFSANCAVELATQISYDDFYKYFHHVGDGEYDAINAARFMAKQEAVAEVEKMNQESEW